MTSYDGRRVVVGGAGISGVATAHALRAVGTLVTVIDRRESAALQALRDDGVAVAVINDQTGDPQLDAVLAGRDALVVSPGWSPQNRVVLAALAAGLEVYSEPELAWRLQRISSPARQTPWLAVTGTNGKTTTVTMLAAIMKAAGKRAIACGNVGYPVISAIGDEPPHEVLAVELSSYQLHWSSQLTPSVGALLNLADDHLDWHGGFDAYRAVKRRIWRGNGVAIGNADDHLVAADLARLDRSHVSFTLGEPRPGQLGVIDGVLVDRAFTADGAIDDGATEETPLIEAAKIRPVGEHNVANALAAIALARTQGVSAEAIRRGLAEYVPEPHRNQYVATVDGVTFVNDSKATNPHAAMAAINSYERIVWLAGGQLKGVEISDFVQRIAPKLVGAVIFGADRAEILAALARHAPTLTVVEVGNGDDGAMVEIVNAAAKLAHSGDVVLLAPAAASFDMFTGYPARGEAFAQAVARLR